MRCDVFKRTTDDWRPSYTLDIGIGTVCAQRLVEVSFCRIDETGNSWRVCVWGEDDCGMEKDFDDEKSAWCCFLEVIGMDYVNMTSLSTCGFVGA